MFKGVSVMTSTRRRLASSLVACALLAAHAWPPPAAVGDRSHQSGDIQCLDGLARALMRSALICYISADPTSSEPKESAASRSTAIPPLLDRPPQGPGHQERGADADRLSVPKDSPATRRQHRRQGLSDGDRRFRRLARRQARRRFRRSASRPAPNWSSRALASAAPTPPTPIRWPASTAAMTAIDKACS